jgi:hypothetical protein
MPAASSARERAAARRPFIPQQGSACSLPIDALAASAGVSRGERPTSVDRSADDRGTVGAAHHRCPAITIGATHDRCPAIADRAVPDDRATRSGAASVKSAGGADNGVSLGNLSEQAERQQAHMSR